MKQISALFLGLMFIASGAVAATTPPKPAPRVSIFSTSTDWEAVTGLMLHEYRGVFEYKNNDRLIGRGLVLY